MVMIGTRGATAEEREEIEKFNRLEQEALITRMQECDSSGHPLEVLGHYTSESTHTYAYCLHCDRTYLRALTEAEKSIV